MTIRCEYLFLKFDIRTNLNAKVFVEILLLFFSFFNLLQFEEKKRKIITKQKKKRVPNLNHNRPIEGMNNFIKK